MTKNSIYCIVGHGSMSTERRHLLRRMITSAAGLTLMAFAVVVSSKAVLGTSPITSVPFVLSLTTKMSLGTANLLFSIVLITVGALIMGRHYRPIYLTQIVTVAVFSAMCDLFSVLLSDLQISGYIFQWGVIILSCLILGLGVSLLIASDLTMMPPEYLVLFISFRTKIDFGRVKIMVDLTLVLAAAVISLLHFGTFVGVREGTLFAALTLGLIIRTVTGQLRKTGFYDSIGHGSESVKEEGFLGAS